ncbi:MAG: hypothetical protein H0X25_16375 [Acidobacteriales bacterium]|nr:hypothetical protein [Terriglobales bacterium]
MRLTSFSFFLLLLAAAAIPAANAGAQAAPAQDLKAMVREVSYNELQGGGKVKFSWRETKKTENGTETRLMVQTKDATLAMLVAINGKAPDAQRQQYENDRLQELLKNTDTLQKKKSKQQSDDENSDRIIRGLPDAFLYTYDGTQPGTVSSGKQGHTLIRLKFKPDPSYNPPSHTEQVLTGMQGTMLIDQQEKRLALIDGTLFQQVGFGWGILGHLDKGGHFYIQQADVGQGHWEITHMILDLTGKILLVKGLRIDEETTATNFEPVPADLTLEQGIALLKKQQQEFTAGLSALPPTVARRQ